jgi:hypothetical protein
LEEILNAGQLKTEREVSDIRFGCHSSEMRGKEKFFKAVCFTETPLNEVHCLLEISSRSVNLEPYGLVFLKEKLREKGVGPVYYLNNHLGDKDSLARALFSLTNTHPSEAEKLLPMFAVFGKHLQPPHSATSSGSVDFLWEREWRYADPGGTLPFDRGDVGTSGDIFIGLCPHDEIDSFEQRFSPLKFIDPTRNIKWYASKLIQARQWCDLKYSVV